MRLKYGVLLALLMAALAASALSLAPRARSEEPATEEVPAGAEELPDKRTATSDTYELHSGMLETRIYDTPVNYEDPEGEWQPIEEGLEEGEDGEIVNGASSVEVSLPSELQEGLALVTIGDQWIGSRLLATETEPAELSEGAAVYESPEASTTFAYTTLPEGLKEEIELEGPSSPSSFRFQLTASAGLTPALAEDGSVVFKSSDGQVVVSLPAPTVADAASAAPDPGPVHYELEPKSGNSWVLTVAVNREWLEAPNRSWPARIDPTITKEAPDLDCTIGGKTGQEGWIDCASWGRENLLAGYNAELNQAEDNWYRSLMNLSTAEIPKGADVSSADLMLYAPESAQNTSGIAVHRILKPWTWQANWKRYSSGHNWEAEGGDYAPEALGELRSEGPNHNGPGTGPGWWAVPIQAAKVQEKSEHDEDLSVIVKLLDDKSRSCDLTKGTCTHRLLKFDSSAAITAAYRPYLRVVYDFNKARPTSKMTSPEDGRKSGHYFTLQSAWDPNTGTVTGVTYQVEQYGPPHEFRTIPGQYVLNGKGEHVEWPLHVESSSGHTEPLYFDYRAFVFGENTAFYQEDIKLRAIFAAGSTAARGASEPVTVEYIGREDGIGGTTDAKLPVGPASVDPLTGNFTLTKTDVSIPVPGTEANLEFTRTYESVRHWRRGINQSLGAHWEPGSPMEQEFQGEAWTNLIERHEPAIPPSYDQECLAEGWPQAECMVEEEIPAEDWIEVFDNEGGGAAFEISASGYVSPEYMKEWLLTKEGESFALQGPEGVRTVFKSLGGNSEYQASTISWQATEKSARMVYQPIPGLGKYRLEKEISPPPPGVSACGDVNSTTTAGCRTLTFQYTPCVPDCYNSELSSIQYFGPSGSSSGQTVAEYRYDSNHELSEEWDPRTAIGGHALVETYSYNQAYRLATLTPSGQEPWQFTYYGSQLGWELEGALKSIGRATLLATPSTATSTIVYRVPVSGGGAPYELSPSTVAQWGQSDYPVDAVAIFPPDQVPPEGMPSDFSHATVHYFDPEGYEVNGASPAPPGAEGASISTSETDMHGNVIRELTPQNRLRALAAGSGSAARSHELDTHSVYNSDGTEMLESWGPLHSVRLESGETKEARAHTIVKYEDETPPPGQLPYYLPTKETTGALQTNGTESDQRTTEIDYDWKLRKPTETTVDPGNLRITSVSYYDESSGLLLQTRQPSNGGGGLAGTTVYQYYGVNGGECEGHAAYSGLLCKVGPASQTWGTGRPELLVKKFKTYNELGEPTEIVESPGGGSTNIRKTVLEYDKAGRQTSKKIEGGGQSIPKVETEYSPTQGAPIAERFKCESECEAPQFLTSLGYASQSHTGLKNPSDVAVDAAGNVWAVDKSNSRIVEYNEAGEFLREAGGAGSSGGKLNSPSGIAIDSTGNLDVTDTANNRVAQFSSTGAFIEVIGSNVNKTKVEAGGTALEKNRCTAASGNTCQAGTAGTGEGQISEPIGITATATGTNFYVVERANNRVEKFSPQAEVLAKFGELGSGNGQLKEPAGIALHGYLLWVADTGNNRMEAFTTSYAYSRQFTRTDPTQFSKPVGVEADASGNVWVALQGTNQVQKFSETGTYLQKFGSPGSEEGKFNFTTPMGLALDGKGNVLVADPGNNRVQKWSTTGFDSQETKTSYDALGRPVTYEDADGNKSETTYDLDGRPVKTTDNKGSQTIRYDATSGLPVELEDSAAGVFTASYNADGAMLERTLPDGLTAETTYDPAGEPMHLTYTKASNCGASCTWLDFGLERSINGQIRKETGTLGTQHYRYDKAGRLTFADETPQGGQCTTRSYTYDVDSNRLSKTTRSPGIGGVCSESGGTTESYEYDPADRLKGPTYDSWGRITSLPAEYAAGKALTTGYFSNDMVASQSQNGISNTFQLDATLRQRQRLQGGGLEGTEVFHYDGPSDSPSWTVRGSAWTRTVVGLGGELVAVQESGQEITLQLSNLHGDISATAALNPETSHLKKLFSFDEFGNPTSGEATRYGWLGGKLRRTDLASGVIQMGARSYVPSIGRFLSTDPVAGGSANTYDYVNANPLGSYDLSGLSPSDSDCYAGFAGCQCKLWTHIAKGKSRGTFFVTVVRKCNRFGGITLQGYAVGWSKRNGPQSDFHGIDPPRRVYPAIEPSCRQLNAPCQNYQKSQFLVHCQPGKEYEINISWGFVFNVNGEGAEHELHVSAQQTCPRRDGL